MKLKNPIFEEIKEHDFEIIRREKHQWGNRVTLSCKPGCCTHPNHIVITCPERYLNES